MNTIGVGCAVKGQYKIQVLEKGLVVQEREWADNMILNQGLDYALSGTYPNVPSLFKYHCVGTGTTAVAATDTGLQSEVKRTGTVVTGAGYTGTTIVGNVCTFRYTWDHTIEGVGGANYTEHGISPSASAGNNLFARSLISGGTVTVAEGQQLRVVYDISVTTTPSVAAGYSVGGTGWPVSPATTCEGDAILQLWKAVLGSLETNGNTNGNALMTMQQVIMTASSALTLNGSIGTSATATAISGSNITFTRDAYVDGSFTRKHIPSAYATAASFNSTSIAGWNVSGTIAFKYDQKQTKDNTHRLRYPSISITWARL